MRFIPISLRALFPLSKTSSAFAAEDVLGQSAQKTVEVDQQSVGRLSRMDALQSQAMAHAQQRRRDAHKQALQAATPNFIHRLFVR